MADHHTAPRLSRDPAFLTFWAASAVSVFGSRITTVVLPILVFGLTGSPLLTSLLATAQVLPYLAFGLVAGALADRVDRRRVMVVSDIANTLLVGSVPIAAAAGHLTEAHLFAVALLSATCFVWFDAASFGAVPALVGRDGIVNANSILGSTNVVAAIVGPSLGGVLAATVGPANAMALDACTYVFSAVALSLVPRPFNLEKTPTGEVVPGAVRRTIAEIREGFGFLWRHRLVRALTLLGFGASFTWGAVLGLLVVYAVDALGLGTRDAKIGLLYTAGAVGALVATVLLPRIVRRFSPGRVSLLGYQLNVLAVVALALAPTFAIGAAAYLLYDAFFNAVVVNGINLRQLVTPDHLQSRVNTTARMIAWGGQPFGAAVAGVVAEFVPVRAALLVMTLGVGSSAAIAWFTPLRERMSLRALRGAAADGSVGDLGVV